MTKIDGALRQHGGTFKLVLRPDWIPTGIWPEVDAAAAEHRAAVDAYEAAVAEAPTKPSLADYDRACRAAIAANEPLPEPPPSPTDDEVTAGRVRIESAADQVRATAQAVMTLCADHGETLANAPTIRGPVRDLDDRITTLLDEIDEARREKARIERLPIWLAKNARHPWIDPTPDQYRNPAEDEFAARLATATGSTYAT